MTDPNRVDSGLSFRFDSDPELVPGPNLMVNFAGLPEPEPPFLAGARVVFWSGSGSGSYSYSYSTVNILFVRDPKYNYDYD